jgi:hypothetical protein
MEWRRVGAAELDFPFGGANTASQGVTCTNIYILLMENERKGCTH